jgi:hypothetical protein
MVGTKELVRVLINNIVSQRKRDIGKTPKTALPLMIWGAPGIGKTAVLSQTADIFKERRREQLMIRTVPCAAIQGDEWGLPAIDDRDDLKSKFPDLNIRNAKSIPKTWLPVFELSGNPEYDQKMNDFYNSGKFIAGSSGNYSGGILFFDEYSRLPKSSANIMMQLTGSYQYGEMSLATGWALIFASNRYQDILHADIEDFEYEMANTPARFENWTYVPTRGEWLRWARQKNTATGRQNVDEMFCAFIETQGDGVWYGALTTGAFQNILNTQQNKDVETYKTNRSK